MISKKCKLHIEEAGMTRWQHFKRALWISWQLEKAAYACFIHAFAPRWFTTYASDKCKEVLDKKQCVFDGGEQGSTWYLVYEQ